MKRNGYIFFGLLGIFHIILVVVSFYMDHLVKKQDLGSLFKISEKAYIFKYVSIVGLILIIGCYILSLMYLKAQQKQNKELNSELNTLKAKLFDLQEAQKNSAPKG